MIFTDGSVNDEYSGVGSCAALVIPSESHESEIKQSEVFSVLADSTEAEVCGIALALDLAIQYFSTRQELDYRESLFVLSDCKAVIDIVINRSHIDGHVHVLDRIRSHLRTLRDMMVDVTLVWIPGHCDIHYNDIVDHCAKSATLDPDNIPSTFVTIDACEKLISKQSRALWPTRWQRANTGKATFDIMPRVGHKLSFPRDRCSAISYIRLLLDDALLNVHQHRAGLKQSRSCECGLGIDITYFITY